MAKPEKDAAAPSAKRAKDNKKKGEDSTADKWFLTPPKAGEPAKQQKGGKDWWWCPNHAEKGKWVRHEPAACEQPKRADAPAAAPPAEDKKTKDIAENHLRVKTLAALLNLEASKEDYDF